MIKPRLEPDKSKWLIRKIPYDGWYIWKPYEDDVWYCGIPEFSAVLELLDIERLRHDFDVKWSLVC